ncbi:MAG: helix-turn-helix transcriptional regulator [Lewinellaceae bacterium]|nr:helix-turn-helix transcriptional regulator [Lewinellaceae bacterium]
MVKDMLFAHYICPQKDKQVKLWSHYNTIAYTLRGKKTYHHGGKSFTTTEGSCIFAQPMAYTEEMYEFAGWETISFSFKDDFLRSVLNDYREYLSLNVLDYATGNRMLSLLNANETSIAFFRTMIQYFEDYHKLPEKLLEMKFRELLYNLLADPVNKEFLAYAYGVSDQYHVPIWQIMESNYMYNLTIPEFAKLADRSLSSLKENLVYFNMVRLPSGLLPGDWSWLKDKLNFSHKTIREIAFDCGFENASHFSRVF